MSEKKRLETISGLRVFFTITIFLSHLNGILCTQLGEKIYKYFASGAYGVNFFFVCSGFMMYRNYFEKFQTVKKEEYFEYIKKKFKRLYPMYMITMLVFVIMEFLDLVKRFSVEGLKDLCARVIVCIPMLQTLSIDTRVSQTFNSAAWFLSCLMIIYVVTPFIFQGISRFKKYIKGGVWMFVACFLICACLNYLWKLYPNAVGLFYCTPYIRIFHYFLGICTAIVFEKETFYIQEKEASILEFVLVALNLYAWLIKKWPARIASGTMQLLIASLTCYVFANEKGKLSNWIKSSGIARFEKLCFDFYLLHYTIIMIICRYYIPTVEEMSNVWMLCIIMFIFATSWLLSYLFNHLRKNITIKIARS